MSEEQDDSQKTEEPSQRKLDEAQKRGQVLQSREINHWFMILAAGVVVMLLSPVIMRQLKELLVVYLANADAYSGAPAVIGPLLTATFAKALLIMCFAFAVLIAAAVLGNILQHGLVFSPEVLMPKLERVSPLAGFKRLFSMRATVELLKGVLKLSIIGAVAFLLMAPMWDQVQAFIPLEMGGLIAIIHRLITRLILGVLAIMTVVAAFDWLYQRMEFMKQMRMSRQELKDEFKQSEGDPAVKQRLRQIRVQRARKRMMAAVPSASVVVTNPTHYAVALKYDQARMNAPVVVAKGLDLIAERIRKVADENSVPIVANAPLARALYTVELDDEIPEEHYKAVAEIIGYVMRLKNRFKPN
ncbi:MAG: flagellar biosynthesis protein FlhB [Dongiaceae bacterium]